MKTIERTDLIDKYLAGTMSETEKNEFERLRLDSETSLEDRTKLQDEMELQKEIIFAIRRRAFREHVQKEIAKIKEEEDSFPLVDLLPDKRKRRKRVIISLTSFGSILAAAVLAFFIIIAPLQNIMYNESLVYAESLQDLSQTRGEEGDELKHQLLMAQMFVLEDNWKQADKIARTIMQTFDPTIADKQLYEDAEWLHLQYLMHQKRTLSAKRLLKKIAGEDGKYSQRAQEILNQE